MKKLSLILLCFIVFSAQYMFCQKKVHHNHKAHAVKHHHSHHKGKNVVVIKPRKHVHVSVLPHGYSTFIYKGQKHYCHNGIWYMHHNKGYKWFYPPFGLRIKVLPVGYHPIFVAGIPYFYFQGVYYRKVDKEYEVVEPVKGAIVPDLPKDLTEEVEIDGKTFYEFEGKLYKKIDTKDGIKYEFVSEL